MSVYTQGVIALMGVNILIHSCAFSVKARQDSLISTCMKNWWLKEASEN